MSLLVTLGLVGLVVDIGWAYWVKLACRTAAQSAAFAAAKAAKDSTTYTVQSETACPESPRPAVPLEVGCLYASRNGFTNGSAGQTVTMEGGTSSPPVAGVAPSYWVSATVSKTVPAWFGQILGQRSLTVRARATAAVFAPPGGGCVYVMNPNASGALSMTGTSSLESGCGVYVNSTSSSAISMTGAADITTAGDSRTSIRGGWRHTGVSGISPAPITGARQTTDPFHEMTPPSAGSCLPDVHLTGTTHTHISEGTYCNQITLSGTSSLTLGPGTYVLKGGLSMTGTTRIDATGGVLLYIPTGSISMTGTTDLFLTAQTSGPYQGVLIWQDESNTNDATLTGGAAQVLNGVLYFPGAELEYTGGSHTSSAATTILANTLRMTGTSYIHEAATTPYTRGTAGAWLIE